MPDFKRCKSDPPYSLWPPLTKRERKKDWKETFLPDHKVGGRLGKDTKKP